MNLAIAQKNHLRARIKHQRNTLTKPFMERSALALLGHLSAAKIIEDHQNFAFYLPIKGEISCWPLIEYAKSLNKHSFLPKVFPNKKRGMWFLPYEGKESVQKGPFGILEPTANIKDAIRPSQLDVIFMPLVAFDNLGNRVGMGGGYYDSVLSNFKKQQKRPLLIGLAYNFQQVSQVPLQSWDVTMDAVATPSYFLKFPSQD
ncbi:5-formyltetrahydrofolate cyclo-ligase [Kangiella sp. TOML190]|uniref:5-formyltetrahydrofolate cyclo-ligase n=1 Tax=Kangiella sp. TOML190 TaxID=2931351 RepID=UPI00203DE142|nr:5-formyltetrahydrofolate cyclo-ligase [Kangiella sp. TOML190]